ncbi:cation:proton antiporter [Candidatus Woesearchaeota archaeon]|nr:cation:proton antiporter [Candidatus Woesearchaeota archaeon]
MEPLLEIAIIFVTATILAYLSKLIKQPIIPAYIIAGIALVATGFIEANSLVEIISSLGIAFLLFLVGLEIDFSRLKNVGLVSTVGCTLVCMVLFGTGFFIAGILGLSTLSAIYIGLVAAFSSTMIVVKLLSDKNQLDTLHGKIIIGFLLMQDIFAIIALFVLSTVDDGFSIISLAATLGMLFAIVGLTYIGSAFFFPKIFKFAAKTEELLFITSISICLIYIGVFHYLGLSIAIGAFLAGVALANLPYNFEIIAMIEPIRDFFAVVFFVSLGMLLNINVLNTSIALILILLAITLLLKPLLILVIVSLFGYKAKPSFFSSISLAQASEFGMILLLLGLSLNHITKELFSSVILVTIITMTLTAYLFEYKKFGYKMFNRYFKFLEKIPYNKEIDYDAPKIKKDVLMIGYDRLGYNIFSTLLKQNRNVVVVDYNPEVIKDLAKKKIPCLYGDVGDVDILNRLDLKNLKMIISTIPEKQDSLMLIKKARRMKSRALLIVTSMGVDDAIDLYKAGADYVILPHFLGGERVSLLLEEVGIDVNKMLKYKLTHLKELKTRKHLKHKHPKTKRHK